MTKLAFRTFFPLAALEAIFVVALWPLTLLAGDAAPVDRLRLGEWHAGELLYGYVAAVLAGFVLTALPRWTATPLVPAAPISLLVALWLAGRVASLFAVVTGFSSMVWLGSLFPIALAAIVGRHVIVARNRRNAKVAVLLGVFALGTVVQTVHSSGSAAPGLGERIGIVAAIGLLMVFGGRITPSFTDAILASRIDVLPVLRRRAIEIPAAVLAGGALVAWVCAPGGQTAGILCGAAALVQSLRLAQWRPLSTIYVPNVFVFHAAYAFVPLGFALVAAQSFAVARLSAEAGVHAWTVGAIGLMSLAVMTSMVRRQTGHALEISRAATGAYVLCGAAGICRVAAAVSDSASDILLVAAAISWIGAFGLFLVLMRSMLRRAGPPSRTVATSGERSMGAENRASDGDQA